MAYIGKGLVGVLNESKAVDTMTGDGSDTTLTLSRTPGSVNNVEVYMDGVFQTPGVEYTLSGNTVSFSTAPETGTEIIALIGNDSTIITPSNNSISGTKIAGAVVTDAKIAGMAANKLSGALPAVDGSALTNIPSSITKNASDPATDSNPAGGVGTMWANTTSGEMFVLTDATTDENVWTNVGGGTGDVQPWGFPGTISGYSSGGQISSSNYNIIDKFSFSSDGDATDVGDLSTATRQGSSNSSSTNGYNTGGVKAGIVVDIDKFSFITDGNGTDIADLTLARRYMAGQSYETHGYTSGGNAGVDVIDKFTFAADNDATDVGNLSVSRAYCGGQSSPTHGYTCGGVGSNVIDKFSFSSDGDATDVGDLSITMEHGVGQSSFTNGYNSGGKSSAANVINKFSFSSDNNATDIGNLTVGRYSLAGQSSTVSGYTSGGYTTYNIIDKFSFSSDGDATDVGNLTVGRELSGGQQV